MGKCYYCGQREESELIAQALMVSYHPHQKQLWEVRVPKKQRDREVYEVGVISQNRGTSIFLVSFQQNEVYLPK